MVERRDLFVPVSRVKKLIFECWVRGRLGCGELHQNHVVSLSPRNTTLSGIQALISVAPVSMNLILSYVAEHVLSMPRCLKVVMVDIDHLRAWVGQTDTATECSLPAS